MLENEIQILQNELNELICTSGDYQKIYEASVRLDKLIVKYYIQRIRDDGKVLDI